MSGVEGYTVTAVDELIEEFADLNDQEACQVLDELGRELPDLPESVYQSCNLVPGCQSRVWMVCRLSDGSTPVLEIQADSDAIIVKGLISILLQMYGGRTPEEALAVDHQSVFESLGLGRLITPQRKNGLHAMVMTIRNFAAAQLGQSAPEVPARPSAPSRHRRNAAPSRTIDGIADEFPVLQQTLAGDRRPVFLDSGASSQKPWSVIEKQREVEEQYYANAFRGRYYFGQRIDDEIEAARDKVAGLVNAAQNEEIVFTAGTTMSLNMIAHGWGTKFLKPGDEILVTEMEHHANFVPWQTVARQTGATLRIAPITDDGLLDPDALGGMIHERTAIVAICTMSNVLGTLNPISQICDAAHRHGAVVVADAAQSVPHELTDVTDGPVDFLAFSGHKLYGPTGVGVLYGRRELLERMDPFVYGGHMIQTVGREHSTWAQPPAKFEAGTLPIVQIIGLGAAVDFVQSIGFEAISGLEKRLLEQTQRQLLEIDGLRVFGPDVDRKGAIVSFAIEGVAAEDLAIRLDRHGICTRHGHHCTMVLHERLGVPATTRASFGLYNTTDDVDVLVHAVREAVQEIRR
jgi:cysteine desulfurase/selenocysteine lyase